MFGSKNSQQKKQSKISIETMEGNLKGEERKAATVEYSQTMPAQTADSNKAASVDNNLPPVVAQKSTVDNTGNSQEPFKSPFNGGDLPIGEAGSAEKNKVGQASFSPAADSLSTETPQKEDSAFLHQAIDGKIDNKNKAEIKQTEIMPAKKKGGINSFVLIMLFVALLAGIILGGYYFYMNKESVDITPSSKTGKTQQPNIQGQEGASKINTGTGKNTTNNKTTPIAPKIEKLVTSPTTFNNDIAKFITELKQRRSAVDLKNGIFISPMATAENPLAANVLLKALHMTEFFKEFDLKDSCKFFVVEDTGEVKVAVIFELAEVADEKLVKDTIMQKEKDLMNKMRYLFVEGIKPTVPTEVVFAVNNENMQARYKNYMPEIDTVSVDWNILDLGKGKIVYFATSRKTAKVLTDYFLRTVTK